jgi:3-keto-disaccharide hydrolase
VRLLIFFFLAVVTVFASDTQFNGRWDITVQHEPRARAWWLEVTGAGTPGIKGRFVGFPGGDTNDIPQLAIQNGELRFSFDYTDNRAKKPVHRDYNAHLAANDKLMGEMRSSDGQQLNWTGVRAPSIAEKDDGTWRDGPPVELFNHHDLAGWRGLIPNLPLGWSVTEGAMANLAGANNLVSEQTFWNFKLHVEYRVGQHSNSGIGLRGRYEVQILEDYGRPPNRHSNGALYSRVAPAVNASKPAGEWQTYDIRLVGMEVTVVLNDQKVIDKQEIEGLTAIAGNADEGKPGPIILQGDHGPVEFRSIVLTPLVR